MRVSLVFSDILLTRANAKLSFNIIEKIIDILYVYN